MLHWVLLPLTRMTDYRGRSRRREYWLFSLAMMLCFGALYAIADFLFPLAEGANVDPALDAEAENTAFQSPDAKRFFNMLARPMLLFFAVVHLPLSIRRLHDTGRRWWAYLVTFLPYIGPFILLWLLIKDSQPYPNQWGPDPKGRDHLPTLPEDPYGGVPLPAAKVRDN